MLAVKTQEPPVVLVIGAADLAQQWILHGGLPTLVVQDSREAIAAMDAHCPQVVVCQGDADLEVLGFLRTARERWPLTQRVLILDREDARACARAVNEGEVQRLLLPPVSPEQVVRAVRAAIEQHERLAENERLLELADRRNNQLRELAQSLEEKVNERTELLIRAKRTWEQTFDAISDPLAIVDLGQKVIRTNLAWAASAGEDVRRIQGRSCHEVLFGACEQCQGCPMQQTVDSNQMATGEVRAAQSGRVFRVATFPMKGKGGAGIDRVVCHYRDVTDDKALQRALLQTEKMAAVGQLAGGIAHEINNPLGAILAFAQLGLRDVDPDGETFDYLKEIEEGALRCKDIVQNLLTFSRPSRTEEIDEIDVNGVVDRTAVLLGHEFNSGRWRLEVNARAGLPLVRGNRNRLQQVVINLLTNAKGAMPVGGVATVTTDVDEAGRVTLSVTDTGTGIAEHVLPKIFEPFFTTKEEGKGTGLGLALSYGIVKEHGGTIEVDSVLGEGSTFRVALPGVGGGSGALVGRSRSMSGIARLR